MLGVCPALCSCLVLRIYFTEDLKYSNCLSLQLYYQFDTQLCSCFSSFRFGNLRICVFIRHGNTCFCTISAPVLKAVWAHIVKAKPVVFMKHVAVRGQLQGLVTVPFTLSIITPKNKMTGFCLFVLGCGKIGLRISYMLSKHFIRLFIMQETCVF